jgi:hypothetical protein
MCDITYSSVIVLLTNRWDLTNRGVQSYRATCEPNTTNVGIAKLIESESFVLPTLLH